jgi:dTDP-glucose 4,6-dehydratase
LTAADQKIQSELNWKAQEPFEAGLRKTVLWYLDNQDWVDHIFTGEYQQWIKKQYL